MYGVAGEKRPIFVESDAFLYNLFDPTYIEFQKIQTFIESPVGLTS